MSGRGNPWQPNHTKLMILLNEQGCSDHVIAGATGHDPETVARHRRALGLEANYRSMYGTWQALPPATLESIRAVCDRIAA